MKKWILKLLLIGTFFMVFACVPDEITVVGPPESTSITDDDSGSNDTLVNDDDGSDVVDDNSEDGTGDDDTGDNENDDDSDDDEEDDEEVAGQNLLTNGGLEQWDNGSDSAYNNLIGWFSHNNHNVKRSETVVTEGTYSAKMSSQKTGSTARIDQRIPVVPGSRIRIRFSYYVEQWKSKGARTYCYFRTAPAEQYNLSADELQAFYSDEEYYIIRGGGRGLTYFPHELDVWQTFDETIEVPPTAHYFVFGINSYHGTTIYVDDCYVIVADEQ